MADGIYIHIPFCKSRCSYCDFATDVYRDADTVSRYLHALENEILTFNPTSAAVDTIYFGGGTPSLLSPDELKCILQCLKEKFVISSDCEITVEMNPGTVSEKSLAGYRNLGVTRASFGVQTFDDLELRLLARGHSADDAVNTFMLLRQAGYDNINFDLIAGLPGQTPEQWIANLERAARMYPEHISLYLLEVHSGTPLAEQIRSGRRPPPDDEIAAEMYNIMCDFLVRHGYRQYEISNFSLPGFESRHNLKYWKMEPVYGFGVSAHSFDGRRRYSNPRNMNEYISAFESGRNIDRQSEVCNPAREALFLGLRLTEGIDIHEIYEKYGIDIYKEFGDDLKRLDNDGLLELLDGRIRLTRKGMLYSNEVFSLFV